MPTILGFSFLLAFDRGRARILRLRNLSERTPLPYKTSILDHSSFHPASKARPLLLLVRVCVSGRMCVCLCVRLRAWYSI